MVALHSHSWPSWPFCFTADVYFFFHFFLRHLISEAAWPIMTKHCHMLGGDPDLYGSEIWEHFPKNIWHPKNLKISD